MSNKERLMRAVASVYAGMTVQEYNEKFAGKSEEEISRYIKLLCAERLQLGGYRICGQKRAR